MSAEPVAGEPRWDGFMAVALEEARRAESEGEVPVGAVVVVDGRVVGRGRNRNVGDRDPSAHAELLALREAARSLGNHRLGGATLVTTLEPCLMCCGAAVHARVERIVHAAPDPKAGALGVLRDLMSAGRVNHRIVLEEGPCAAESSALLRRFFAARRAP
jgi:tRNA(adenine34) deaminase